MKKMLLISAQFFIIIYVSFGQIIYTNINPDVVLNQVTPGTLTHSIDINNDGINDFEIQNSYSVIGDTTYSKCYVIADSGNEVAVDGQHFPLALTSDTLINNSFNYDSTNLNVLKQIKSQFGANFTFLGNWLEGNDRFLGVRFNDKGVKKYGWIEMQMDANQATVVTTLKGYAYDTTGGGILAGDTSGITGIEESTHEGNISIIVLDHTGIIRYNGSLTRSLDVMVSDISGREIQHLTGSRNEVHIDLSGWIGKAGVITVQSGNEILTKKILIL